MKKTLRIISFLLAVIMLASPVMAAENVSPKASDYFWKYSASLYKVSGTTFQVWFDVGAVGTMSELGASKIVVQRSSDGSTWLDMKTYTRSGYSQMIATNTVSYTNCVTYIGTSGYHYRACVTLYAKDSSGSSTRTLYTSTLYLTG